MPRKEELPDRELEICRRLRAFRESTKIARTVFAAEAGIVGARLLNCELGLTPVSYGLFKAINRRFFVRPAWLVYGQGVPASFEPFDDERYAAQVSDRQLLSATCDRWFQAQFAEEQQKADSKIFGEGGLWEQIRRMHSSLRDPQARRLIPKSILVEAATLVDELSRQIKATLRQHEGVQDAVRSRARRPRKKSPP